MVTSHVLQRVECSVHRRCGTSARQACRAAAAPADGYGTHMGFLRLASLGTPPQRTDMVGKPPASYVPCTVDHSPWDYGRLRCFAAAERPADCLRWSSDAAFRRPCRPRAGAGPCRAARRSSPRYQPAVNRRAAVEAAADGNGLGPSRGASLVPRARGRRCGGSGVPGMGTRRRSRQRASRSGRADLPGGSCRSCPGDLPWSGPWSG